MKLLIMSDIHARYPMFAPPKMCERSDVDAVLIAGDITNMGRGMHTHPQGSELHSQWRGAQDWMKSLSEHFGDERVFWVPGNHDIRVQSGDLAGICLVQEYSSSPRLEMDIKIGSYSLLGAALCTSFDSPELSIQWAHTTASTEYDRAFWEEVPPADIIVSHCPPLGVLDNAGKFLSKDPATGALTLGPERRIGSPGLREYILRHSPKLVICGHVHEATGEALVGTTRVINTAQRWQVIEL